LKVKAKAFTASTTGQDRVVGVALEDIPANSKGSVAMEGVFIHQAVEGVEAGHPVQTDENATNKVAALDVATTTVGVDIVSHKIGRYLSGASGANEHVFWKLSL
jgi:predicted RecA/RadA family phage recombinase